LKKVSFVRLTLIGILLIQIGVILNIRPWRNAEKKNALINWDVTSYYSYLPAIFVHKDLKFEFLNNSEVNYAEKHQFWPETAPNGNKVIKTTMGMSVLYFPFFIISHIYSLVNDKVVANGFSKPYEIGLTFSSIFYMMIGLFFLAKVLRSIYDEKKVSILLFLVFLGTNLFYYATTEPCMSHVYTFSLASVFMYITMKIYEKNNWKFFIFLGLISGLLFLVRPTNILFILAFLLYKIESFSSLNKRLYWLIQHYKKLTISIVISVLIGSVQFFYWKWATGNWFFNSYVGEQFYFNQPRIIEFLFSYRKGWLVYTPIFVFSFLGLYKMYVRKNPWFFSILIMLPVLVYLFSSWWCWWFGGGFGMRPMIDYYPLLIIPLGEILSTKISYKKYILNFILAGFVSLNLFQTLQRRNLVIHWDSMSKESYWAFFTTIKMKNAQDWERQKILLNAPDYNKARNGELEYDFEVF
tara:strand:- start:3841 stop:5241 length:1401 start_codon:yes stop_codon:yes gene_type:complete